MGCTDSHKWLHGWYDYKWKKVAMDCSLQSNNNSIYDFTHEWDLVYV